MILDQLIADLEERLEGLHGLNKAKPLSRMPAIDVIAISAPFVNHGVITDQSLTATVKSIGDRLSRQLDLPMHSGTAAKIGGFVLTSFIYTNMVEIFEGHDGKNVTYYLRFKYRSKMTELLDLIPTDKVENMPRIQRSADWQSGRNANGTTLVKYSNEALSTQMTPEEKPMIFDAVNKAQRQGWRINDEVFKVYHKLLYNPELAEFEGSYAFDHMDPEEKVKAIKSKELEATTIAESARKLKGEVFYHMYTLDFRGRVYPNSAFLHEQSSDNAKGLLLMESGRPLGEHGLDWLCMHATNSWGADKLSILGRMRYARRYMDQWIQYAMDPLQNRGWIKAEKPWSFLACCIEFMRIAFCNDPAEYVCALPIYVDGSNNGVQHLAALSKDHTVAPLVNLVKQRKVGDVYMHIANKAWEYIEQHVDHSLDGTFEELHSELRELNHRYEAADKAARSVIREQFAAWRERNKEMIAAVAPNFWVKVTSPKQRRKVCKRNVMTLGYGGTEFGFGQQILEDTPRIDSHFRGMPKSWANYMGSLVYNICRGERGFDAALPGPAKLLGLFETLAERSSERNMRLGWTVPVTGMPVLQQYRKCKSKRVDVDIADTRYSLSVRFTEEKYLDKSKQKTAASPNIIHSFDAAHLIMTVTACEFPTVTVHDSFGCLPGDMADLFEIVRHEFVRFYDSNPLVQLLEEQSATDLFPNQGDLDIMDVIESDFAFA